MVGGGGGGKWGEGLQLQLLCQKRDQESLRERSARQGGVPTVHWADASPSSRGFPGTAATARWPAVLARRLQELEGVLT